MNVEKKGTRTGRPVGRPRKGMERGGRTDRESAGTDASTLGDSSERAIGELSRALMCAAWPDLEEGVRTLAAVVEVLAEEVGVLRRGQGRLLFTCEEAAGMLGISRSTLQKLQYRGEIGSVRFNGEEVREGVRPVLRFSREELERFVRSRSVGPSPCPLPGGEGEFDGGDVDEEVLEFARELVATL